MNLGMDKNGLAEMFYPSNELIQLGFDHVLNEDIAVESSKGKSVFTEEMDTASPSDELTRVTGILFDEDIEVGMDTPGPSAATAVARGPEKLPPAVAKLLAKSREKDPFEALKKDFLRVIQNRSDDFGQQLASSLEKTYADHDEERENFISAVNDIVKQVESIREEVFSPASSHESHERPMGNLDKRFAAVKKTTRRALYILDKIRAKEANLIVHDIFAAEKLFRNFVSIVTSKFNTILEGMRGEFVSVETISSWMSDMQEGRSDLNNLTNSPLHPGQLISDSDNLITNSPLHPGQLISDSDNLITNSPLHPGQLISDIDNWITNSPLHPTQLFTIGDFLPQWGFTTEDTKVFIVGSFLEKLARVDCRWHCMFGKIEVPAELVGDGAFRCYAPKQDAGLVPFYITCGDGQACSQVREFDYRSPAFKLPAKMNWQQSPAPEEKNMVDDLHMKSKKIDDHKREEEDVSFRQASGAVPGYQTRMKKHLAAKCIQLKYRGWKGKKDYRAMRRRCPEIQEKPFQESTFDTNLHTLGEDNSGDHEDNQAPSTAKRQDPQIRSDVQAEGFTSWDQSFCASQVLFLCDATTSKDEVHFMFFHPEGMADLFGVGIRHSIVSVAVHKAEVIIKEITENSWKSFWTSSYEGPFKPFLCKKAAPRRNVIQPRASLLTQDQALSTFGVCIDGQQVQEFVEMSKSLSPGEGSQMWTLDRQIQILLAMSKLSESETNGFQKREHEADDQTLGRLQSTTASTAAEKMGLKRLVVHIEFHPIDCALYDWNDKQRRDRLALPKGISSIFPEMKVVFTRGVEGNFIDTTLDCKYEIGDQGQIDWPDGWHQTNLLLSFQSNEHGSQCSLKDVSIRSACLGEDVERTMQLGNSTSYQHDVNLQGSVSAPINVQVSGKRGRSGQSSNNNQRKWKSSRKVLKERQSFCIEEKTVHESALMQFRAFDTNPENALEGEGSQSTVRMEVEGKWKLYCADPPLIGGEFHRYGLQASKELYKRTSTSLVPLPIRIAPSSVVPPLTSSGPTSVVPPPTSSGLTSFVPGPSNVGPTSVVPLPTNVRESSSSLPYTAEFHNIEPWMNSDCSWSRTGIQMDGAGRETSCGRLVQVFNRKFILNHNFCEFFGSLEREYDHHWRQVDDYNPVEVALRADK